MTYSVAVMNTSKEGGTGVKVVALEEGGTGAKVMALEVNA